MYRAFLFLIYLGLPKLCRHCEARKDCRKGIFHRGNCRKGCLIINAEKAVMRSMEREQQEQDRINSLIEYADNRGKAGYKHL